MAGATRSQFRHSLVLRLIGVVLLIQLITLGILAWAGGERFNSMVEKHVLAVIEDVGDILSANVSLLVFTRNFAATQEIVRGHLARFEPSMRYIIVEDELGDTFAQAGELPPVGTLADQNLRQALVDGRFDFSHPLMIANNRVGTVRLGYSLRTMYESKRSLLADYLTIGSFGVFLTAVTLGLSGYLVSRRINTLIHNARDIAKGHYDSPINTQGQDEVADLAGAFSSMTAAIRERTGALELAKQEQGRLLVQTREQQARLTALLSAMDVGILFESTDGRVEFVNPAFKRIWGMAADAPVNEHTMEDLFDDYPHSVRKPVHKSGQTLLEIELAEGRTLTQSCVPVNDPSDAPMGRLRLYVDVTRDRQTARQLLYLAERDALTGLANRHRFQHELNRQLARAGREGARFALFYFDLDDFKYINDTFGHRTGDTVLVRVANELGTQIRGEELFARLGGDEFALLSSVDDEIEINTLAERLTATVARIPLRVQGENLRLTCSMGVAVFPDHGSTCDDLVAHADAAMYHAKRRGKNGYALYDPSDDTSRQALSDMTWNERIRHALEEELFQLHFQGVYRVDDLSLSHLEVLLRLVDEDDPNKLIPPGKFIPLAEKTGRIVEIDRWVVRTTVALLAAKPHIQKLAINLSGRSLDDTTLPRYIENTLTQAQVEPARLLVEITETSAVSDMQDAQRFIDELHKIGCQICLDDFGAGFSSFVYLKYLDVDVLKIDGVFIRDLPEDEFNQVFVRAMVDVGNGLAKTMVAEFVENESTLDWLRQLGVSHAQGFHLDRPRHDHPALQPPAQQAAG